MSETTIDAWVRAGMVAVAMTVATSVAMTGCSSSDGGGGVPAPTADAAGDGATGDGAPGDTGSPGSDTGGGGGGDTSTTDSSASDAGGEASSDAGSDGAGGDASSDAGSSDVGAETSSAACPGSPATKRPVPSGGAMGDLIIRERDTKWVSSALVPIAGTSFVQVIVSDDPALCATLQSNSQASGCSLSPGSGAADVTKYSYLAASFSTPSRENSGVTEMPFYSGAGPRIDAVGLKGSFIANEAFDATTGAITGQFYVCEPGLPLYSSGNFNAVACAGAKPICF